MAVLFGLSVTCVVMGLPLAYAGVLFATLLLMTPVALYLALARALAADRIHTDPKTVEFSPTQIVVTGPDWKSEMTWTRFKHFAEDSNYFYLDLSDNRIGSVIPKSAFSPEQIETIRRYAKAQVP